MTLMGVPDTPGIAGRVTTALADANVNIDMIIQNEPALRGRAGRACRSRSRATTSRAARAALAADRRPSSASRSTTDEAMGKVSIVGAGMKSHPGVAAKVFTVARRQRHQHRDDLDVADPHLLRRAGRPGRPTPSRRCTRAFELQGDGHDPPGAAVRGVRIDESRRVAVVGATGAVGTEHAPPAARPRASRPPRSSPFASERSAGRSSTTACVVQPLRDDDASTASTSRSSRAGGVDLEGVGAALRRRGRDRRRQLVSAFRMDPDVPLVVSEVNPDALDHIGKGIVANPNCTTMAIMLPLQALHDEFGLTRDRRHELPGRRRRRARRAWTSCSRRSPVLLADPDALADDGAAAAAQVDARASTPRRSPSTSCRCWARDTGNGYTDEEMKLQNESRKILGIPDLAVSPTCVRVPVMVGHAIEVARDVRARAVASSAALEVMGAFHDGVELDDVPTPLEWAGRDEVAVGRVRLDLGDPHAPQPLRRRRQPAQGRRAEHRADRRAAARARPRRRRAPDLGQLGRGLGGRLPLRAGCRRGSTSAATSRPDREQDRRDVERGRVAVDRGGGGQARACARGWRRSWRRRWRRSSRAPRCRPRRRPAGRC